MKTPKEKHEGINALLNQILAFQRDGFTDFNFKTGRELNPDTGKLEECIVLDMTKEDQTKTVFFHDKG